MLPSYILKVDFISTDTTSSEGSFHELLAPSLIHLDALKGAFDRKPSTTTYYPPGVLRGTTGWSARCVVMISVGKNRAEYLIQLYDAIVSLIELELPHLEIHSDVSKFEFS